MARHQGLPGSAPGQLSNRIGGAARPEHQQVGALQRRDDLRRVRTLGGSASAGWNNQDLRMIVLEMNSHVVGKPAGDHRRIELEAGRRFQDGGANRRGNPSHDLLVDPPGVWRDLA